MDIRSLAIIEDDDKVRNYLTEQIQLHANIPDILSFSDGESALAALTKYPVDIALFDVQLPGISGIECTRRLKMIHPRMQMMMLTV